MIDRDLDDDNGQKRVNIDVNVGDARNLPFLFRLLIALSIRRVSFPMHSSRQTNNVKYSFQKITTSHL